MNDVTIARNDATPSLVNLYAGARYGVLTVKYVPNPEPYRRQRRTPRVRAFCVVCKDTLFLTAKQLARGTCPRCSN